MKTNNKKVILMAPSTSQYGGGIANWTNKILRIGIGPNWEYILVDEKPNFKKNPYKKSFFDFFKEIKRTLKIYSNLKRELKNKNVKIVHIAIPSFFLSMLREYFSVLIAKRKNIKVIIHFRSTLPNAIQNKRTLSIFKKLVKIVDYVIVLNSKSLKFLNKYSNVPSSIIENFIDQEVLDGEKAQIKKNVKEVLYTGTITKEKGCFDIIEVAKYFPNIKFKLMGVPSPEIIKNMPYSKNIYFINKSQNHEVINELRRSDIFLFPTYFSGEGFSNALLEAMAVGLPCVATDWAANKDMIEDSGGKIIPARDLNQLINAIRETSESYEKRKKFSLWNIEKAKMYSHNIIIKRYIKLYDELSN